MSDTVRLADLTTLRLGGPTAELVSVTSVEQLVAVMKVFTDTGRSVLVLGGGSNLVIADAGVDGAVVQIAIMGITVRENSDGTADVTIGAGEPWDDVVAQLMTAGLTGLAPLSGIPGSTGATVVQNVGAYGTEIADMLSSVTLFERATGEVREVGAADLELGYRSSVLRKTDRAIVTGITLRLGRTPTAVKYAELARVLGVEPGRTAEEPAIRHAVLGLRRSKGMVIEPGATDPDTRSAGSFFTNPILDRDQADQADRAIKAKFGPDVIYPRYPAGAGLIKLSAAWLIERAGFPKGFDGPGGRVGLSTKHTLALVNRDGTTADLLELARQIRDGVREAFEVDLHPEPVFVGVTF